MPTAKPQTPRRSTTRPRVQVREVYHDRRATPPRTRMSWGALAGLGALLTIGLAIVGGIVNITLYLGGFDKSIAVLQTQQTNTASVLADIKNWMTDMSKRARR